MSCASCASCQCTPLQPDGGGWRLVAAAGVDACGHRNRTGSESAYLATLRIAYCVTEYPGAPAGDGFDIAGSGRVGMSCISCSSILYCTVFCNGLHLGRRRLIRADADGHRGHRVLLRRRIRQRVTPSLCALCFFYRRPCVIGGAPRAPWAPRGCRCCTLGRLRVRRWLRPRRCHMVLLRQR